MIHTKDQLYAIGVEYSTSRMDTGAVYQNIDVFILISDLVSNLLHLF